jgi:hypothetical protein
MDLLGVAATTNYQAIVRPLQWLVVILIFLFFIRVIRAVYVETNPGGRRKERNQRPGGRGGRGLVVIEPVERAGERFDVDHDATLSIGRSATCDVVIAEDIYSSTVHTRISRDDTGLHAEDLASTNGTYVNAERIHASTRLTRGDVLQVGGTVFEVIR